MYNYGDGEDGEDLPWQRGKDNIEEILTQTETIGVFCRLYPIFLFAAISQFVMYNKITQGKTKKRREESKDTTTA